MKKSFLFACSLLMSFGANADLDDVFKSYTKSSSAHFKGEYMQSVVGSSFHSRNPTMFDRQLYSVQLPSWNAGCGSIDVFSGSFSLITKDEIVQMARGIAQGAPGYFFNLAMDTVCPDCSANMKELSRRLNSYNQEASGSCEKFWDKFTDVSGIKSQAEGLRNFMETEVPIGQTMGGLIPDYGEWLAGRATSAGTTRETPVGTIADDLSPIRNNAIYEILQADDDLYTSPILDGANIKVWELFMSFFGYRVLDVDATDPNAPKPLPKPQKASIDLRDFIYGDQDVAYNSRNVQLYSCNERANPADPGCLNVSQYDLTWPGLLPENENMLFSAGSPPGILQRIAQRTNLDDDQKKFIVTYPFDYVNWSRKCFIGAQPQIAKFVAIQVTFNVLGDTLNQLASEVRRQLYNGSIEPELMISPAEVEALIDNKMLEFEELRSIALNDAEVTMRSISTQLEIALNTGVCEEFGA